MYLTGVGRTGWAVGSEGVSVPRATPNTRSANKGGQPGREWAQGRGMLGQIGCQSLSSH